MSQQIKQQIKIEEFQWYQLQTKMREYVFQLFQPFQRKQIQQSAKISQIKRQLIQHKQKIKQHSFLLSKSVQKPLYFVELENKMENMSNSLVQSKTEYIQHIQNFKVRLLTYDQKINKLANIQSSLQQERKLRINDKQQINKKLQKQMRNLLEALQSQNNQIIFISDKLKQQIQKIETQVKITENKIRNIQNILKSNQNQLMLLKNQDLQLLAKLNKIQIIFQSIQKRTNHLQQSNHYTKKFVSVLEALKNQFYFIQNYIDKYLPLFIQSQISDTLDSCISGNSRTKLCLYEQRIYNSLNQRIVLGNKKLDLQQNIKNYLSVIEKIIIRNKKYVIKLKVDRIIDLTKELRYESHLQQQQKQEIEVKSTNDSILKTLKSEKNINQSSIKTLKTQYNVPEQKIKQVMLQNWRIMSNEFRCQIKQIQNLVKLELKQNHEIIDRRIIQIQHTIQKNLLETNNIQAQSKLQIHHLSKKLDQFQQSQTKIKSSQIQIKSIIKQIIQFSNIINHLIIQDQIDRQGLALYGLKQNFKQKEKDQKDQPNITLESKCFSCSGFPASTLNAFKMACLAYNPSNVLVEGKQYKRQQILELSTKILMSIKSSLKQQKKIHKIYTSRNQFQTPKQQKINTSSIHNSRILQANKTILPSLSINKKDKKQLINRNSSNQLFYF